MTRFGPELVTFLSSPDDLARIRDSTFDLLTPFIAINAGTEPEPDWYLLTWRDLMRTLDLGLELTPMIAVADVMRYARPLAVNETEKPSVFLDDFGNPEAIVIADPFADALKIQGLTGAPKGLVFGVPVRRRRRGGAATVPRDAIREPSSQVTRTPHMTLAPWGGAIVVDSTIDVTVFADTASQAQDEESESITLDAKGGPIDVQVRLETSAHLEVIGDAVRPLTIDPTVDSTAKLSFSVKAVRSTVAGENARITAYFSQSSRPCGLVRRILGIAARPGDAASKPSPPARDIPPPPASTGRLDVYRGLVNSDILVVVRNPAGDLKDFRVEVHTRLLPENEYQQGPVNWTFGDITSSFVHSMFKQFEASHLSRGQRHARLLGAGIELWKKAPANFVNLFWTLITRDRLPTTIAVVSEEPYIPWELMVPFRVVDSLPDVRDLPLGVEFTVARWTTNDMITAPQGLAIARSRVVAPRYKKPLEHAEKEAEMVLKRVPGERIDPADFNGIIANLADARASLLHFTCHGVAALKDEDGEPLVGVQAIELEGTNEVLDSREVTGSKAFRTFFRQRPLVFLNACEIGRPAPALNGIGGFASSFTELGAAGVIAPLWSVDDEVAFKVSTAIYDTLWREPRPTFAEVMRSIRARAYVGDEMGEDSYAAYCFFGDPLARPV